MTYDFHLRTWTLVPIASTFHSGTPSDLLVGAIHIMVLTLGQGQRVDGG